MTSFVQMCQTFVGFAKRGGFVHPCKMWGTMLAWNKKLIYEC
jgi:hypothetical protein